MADNRVLTKAKPARISSWIFRYAVKIATLLTVLAVCLIIGYILIMGIPQIKPEMFELEYNSDNVSFMPALFNTLIVIVMAVSCSSIFGIGAAIFLNEYTNKQNFLYELLRLQPKRFLVFLRLCMACLACCFLYITCNGVCRCLLVYAPWQS